MSKLQTKRLILTLSIIISIAIGIGILLYTLKQNINLFYTPSEVLNNFEENHSNILTKNIRLGGIVVPGSVKTNKQASLNHEFSVTDNKYNIKVVYTGILPDLFKEDKAIVAEGKMQDKHTFIAQTLLAKHDENYKPPKLKNI